MTKPGAKGHKREQVSNACTSCRLSKLKCNGRHPTCYRCYAKDLACVYDVSEGMTKRQHLNHELVEQKLELERATVVLRVLQCGTDQESTDSLARLRFGSSVHAEYDRLQSLAPQPVALLAPIAPQAQLPTPATEQPDGPTPWGYHAGGCPPSGHREWKAADAEGMEWANPLSPVSQHSSGAGESPFIEMPVATSCINGRGDTKPSYMGG